MSSAKKCFDHWGEGAGRWTGEKVCCWYGSENKQAKDMYNLNVKCAVDLLE